MINSIINDAKGLQAEAMRAEEDAQTGYELMVKDTNELVTEKQKESLDKTEQKAKTDEDKVEAEVSLDETNTNLESLANENHDLHIDCDFLTKNWDIINTARDEEIEALKQAIAMFSGASFSAFLQAS